ELRLRDWAIEARIYAEDPSRNFLPSIGRINRYIEPASSKSVRIDSGVYEGAEVGIYYDPMMAKLVTCASNRDEAVQLMQRALDAFYIRGVGNNLGFLSAVVSNKRFLAGRFTTGFIAEEFPGGFPGEQGLNDQARLLAVLAAVAHSRQLARE